MFNDANIFPHRFGYAVDLHVPRQCFIYNHSQIFDKTGAPNKIVVYSDCNQRAKFQYPNNINSVFITFRLNLLALSQSEIWSIFGMTFSLISSHVLTEFDKLASSAYIVM